MGFDVTKPVFGVSDKATLKPVSSETKARKLKFCLLQVSLDMILSKQRITNGLISLCLGCSQTPKTGFLTSKPIYYVLKRQRLRFAQFHQAFVAGTHKVKTDEPHKHQNS